MQFVPYPQICGVPHVIVDGTGAPGSVLVLSHQPGVRTPPELRGDTSTEIVLRFLDQADWQKRLAGVTIMSNDHFDLDGLLAAWALANPDAARARRGPALAAARAGDFHWYREDAAAHFACLIRGTSEWAATPSGRPLAGLSAREREAALYLDLLPLVADMLDDSQRFDEYWFLEYTDVIRSNAMRYSGAVQVEEFPDLDLAVLDTPLDLHDLTRLSCSSLSRLLTVRSENTYTFEYRYESWVQYASRRVLPRLDLAPLAMRLNLFERFPGRWRAETTRQPQSRLYLDNGSGPAPSSIARETLVAEVLDYLRANAANQALQWSPYSS